VSKYLTDTPPQLSRSYLKHLFALLTHHSIELSFAGRKFGNVRFKPTPEISLNEISLSTWRGKYVVARNSSYCLKNKQCINTIADRLKEREVRSETNSIGAARHELCITKNFKQHLVAAHVSENISKWAPLDG